ncbi:alpha/beta-hydrolase [Fragilariopsis cylindrus CCMP1102]|uniref:Alpha/beta-hydrolase n=1 Tax=Fragilariopsis cylindrus CCMP1102 TaxID=635003 RepID=A0A1E7F715_9STRA|nr:alpha/beta-hydrolase [Fragilariopsis cylindrus CCMP1102]|eukprot:OEU13919.1 alpha/beta-hydrolase [Fragilariopsis cylindrus CCMP1102]
MSSSSSSSSSSNSNKPDVASISSLLMNPQLMKDHIKRTTSAISSKSSSSSRGISSDTNEKKEEKNKDSSSIHLPFDPDSVDFPYDALYHEYNSNEDEDNNINLFSEIYSMAYASAAIFALADVREAAREGIIDAPEAITLPLTINAIEQAFLDNEEILKKKLKPADFAFMESLTGISNKTKEKEVIEGEEEEEKENHSDENDARKKMINMLQQCTLDYCGDDNSENDCVYLIFKNPILKRITVCFRGSITYQDWIKDAKVVVGDIPNPLSDRPDQPPTIGVHLGFKEYLYGTSRKTSISQLGAIRSSLHVSYSPSSSSVSNNEGEGEDESNNTVDDNAVIAAALKGLNLNENTKNNIFRMSLNIGLAVSKFKAGLNQSDGDDTNDINEDKNDNENDTIDEDENENENGNDINSNKIDNDDDENDKNDRGKDDKILEEIEDLLKQNEGYKLYITGHSLGGALGLLTALEAGTRFGTPALPVTFVGIANPRGGTEAFRDAITILEKESKLRCICVHGHLDLVPMIPASPPNTKKSRRFCQSGIELVLESDKFTMRYSPRADGNYIQRVGLVLRRAHKIAERHHYMTYLKDLENLAKPMSELYLNDYYNMLLDSDTFPSSEKKLTPMVVTLNGEGDDYSCKFNVDQDKEADTNDGDGDENNAT